jgi:alpha-galactosidase
MRIGADVAPSWEFGDDWHLPGLVDVHPATRHAYRNTLTRAFQHRHLWLNDPDCLMLRVEQTAMSPEAVRTWAHTVGVSGGMALVSDDLALLGSDARSLLEEVLEIGRWCDDAARAGRPARCPDLLTHSTPAVLEAAGYRLETDPATAASSLYRPEP